MNEDDATVAARICALCFVGAILVLILTAAVR